MKNLKKILALCLAGMMVFSMAACGGTSDNTAGEAGSGSAGKEEAAETAGEMAASDTGSQETETKDSGEREKIVISCYLADDAQVAVTGHITAAIIMGNFIPFLLLLKAW